MRKKILEAKLERRARDNQEVFEFLQLLKRSIRETINEFNPMHKEDWIKVAKK